MGNFKIEIEMVGDHGANRSVGNGHTLDPDLIGDGEMGHVDKVAFDTVELLKAKGCSPISATLTHWPGTPFEVVDDLLEKVRRGSF